MWNGIQIVHCTEVVVSCPSSLCSLCEACSALTLPSLFCLLLVKPSLFAELAVKHLHGVKFVIELEEGVNYLRGEHNNQSDVVAKQILNGK